ncbi:MAG: MFS transporter [Pseudomonadota bacterium]|nr:MFS transporter [Pseudomonadota bacterium]
MFISLGTRWAFGLWLEPASLDLFGAGQLKILSLSIALQSLFWGVATPVAGAIADKYGAGRVIAASGILYASGLILMTVSATPLMAHFSIGVLTGFALSGTMFPIILSAISRSVSAQNRSLYLGIASAGGSSGQVLIIPISHFLIDAHGWVVTLYVTAAITALLIPLAFVMATGKGSLTDADQVRKQGIGEAIREALNHRGYILLTCGYFVCGLQTMFIGTHFPTMLASLKVDAAIAAMSLSLIGGFNILGTFAWGMAGGKYRQKFLLCWLYSLRSLIMAAFILLPPTSLNVVIFSCLMGLLWLGTIPLTGSIVAQVFGLHHMGMLFGFTFVAHQLGSFIGIYAAGYLFDLYGNYNAIWWAAIVMGLLASLVNYPINDTPIKRKAGSQRA